MIDENKLIEDIEFAIQASNKKHDNYMTGLRNGMRYCLSLIIGKEPEFEKCERWIPCSERLPEDMQKCLTTSKIYFTPDHVDEIDNYFGIEINTYSKKYGWLNNPNVIAWMPLPEPYKSGD